MCLWGNCGGRVWESAEVKGTFYETVKSAWESVEVNYSFFGQALCKKILRAPLFFLPPDSRTGLVEARRLIFS